MESGFYRNDSGCHTATGWSGTAPTSYTFTAPGAKTLYTWAKDAAENVSAGVSAAVTVTGPTGSPLNILWRNTATGGQNRVWHMDGITRIGNPLLTTESDLSWKIVGVK